MTTRQWAAAVVLVICMVGLYVTVILTPSDRQSGEPVPDDPRRSAGAGLTTYCLPDSRLRVFERPFPSGGTQPLFSVVEVAHEPPGSPYKC